jgi:serine/threonine-protein kinase
LKRIEVSGNAVQTICDAPQGRGATWGPDGTIVFTPNVYGAMQRVPASGGNPVAAESAVPPGDASHRNPHFLPDGKSVLYYVAQRGERIRSRPKRSEGRTGATIC